MNDHQNIEETILERKAILKLEFVQWSVFIFNSSFFPFHSWAKRTAFLPA